MSMLVRYDAACTAIAVARSVDEAKDIHDKAEALRAYARQAKNRELEVDAAEIRIRAERRVGELIQARKRNAGLAKGGAEKGVGRRGVNNAVPLGNRIPVPTLAEAGIDKKLSSRSQRLAAVPEPRFEAMLSEWRGRAAAETERVTTNLIREGERRRIGVSTPQVPEGRYSTIVADPPWSYRNKSGRHAPDYNKDGRVMTLDEVKAFDIGRWLPDGPCHLYLWVTDAYAGHVYQITEAWGFEAKTLLVWIKDRIGMGNYFRHRHELCVFAVKGNMRLRRMDAPTVFHAPVTRHSEKPEEFYRLVESCSPGPYLDVFARRKRPGWDAFGDQIEPDVEAGPEERRDVAL